ncbi:MAG: hypothetical protein EOO05_03845 [Chitinophagaceae bacterium]|nr:MAG: hypothetical protein EOO05_03845 [Chitinophagaceae bacterium]
MSNPENISNELNELKSSLAGSGRPGGSFAVPQGYFDGFAQNMLERVRLLDVSDELAGLSPVLAGVPKVNPYSVPSGYFDSLDPMVPNRDEDISLSPLMKGLQKKQSFSVPEGYFGKMAAPSVADPVSPLLESISRVTPYTVPAGYFASLNPMQQVAEPVSPLLDSISRVTPYTVPAGYFASLEPMAAVRPAKVISMGASRWKQYAAAASVVIVISLGSIFYFNRNTSDSADNIIAAAAKEAPARALDDFFNLDDAAIDQAIQSDNRILAAVKAQDAKEISKLVKNVPDKEIQAFLNETESAESDIDEDPLLN